MNKLTFCVAQLETSASPRSCDCRESCGTGSTTMRSRTYTPSISMTPNTSSTQTGKTARRQEAALELGKVTPTTAWSRKLSLA